VDVQPPTARVPLTDALSDAAFSQLAPHSSMRSTRWSPIAHLLWSSIRIPGALRPVSLPLTIPNRALGPSACCWSVDWTLSRWGPDAPAFAGGARDRPL